MNWEEINKKYPKAFDLFFEWFKGDPKAGMTKKEFLEVNDIVIMYGNLRELYDFFDEQEIYITITRSHGFDADICKGCECYPYIEVNRELAILARDRHKGNHFKSRTEAEEAAFTKAFFLLEDKLCKQI